MANQKYDAFLTVARLGSFKAAAEELGYTQAGISYLVNALEKELGLTLFLREYGGVHLTTEGREVLGLVQAINADEHALAARVRELADREGGLVRVGAFTSVAIEWFPSIARAFLDQYPKIDLKLLCIDDEEELVNAVWEGRADCAFSIAPERRNLEAVPLHTDPLLVVLPPDHPLAGAPFFPTEALAREPYVQLQGNARPSEMEALFEANGVTPNVRFTVDSDYAVMSMVSARPGLLRAAEPHSVAPSVPARRAAGRARVLPQHLARRALARHRLGRHPRLRRSHPRMGRRALRDVNRQHFNLYINNRRGPPQRPPSQGEATNCRFRPRPLRPQLSYPLYAQRYSNWPQTHHCRNSQFREYRSRYGPQNTTQKWGNRPSLKALAHQC